MQSDEAQQLPHRVSADRPQEQLSEDRLAGASRAIRRLQAATRVQELLRLAANSLPS